MQDDSDDRVVFAAIAQGQFDALQRSNAFKWEYHEPYNTLVKASQIISMRGGEINLISLSAECKGIDWSDPKTVWKESQSIGQLEWKDSVNRIMQRSMKKIGLGILEEASRSVSSGKNPKETLIGVATQLSSLVEGGSTYDPTPSVHYNTGVMGKVIHSTGVNSIDKMFSGGIWSQALIGLALPSNHGKSTMSYTLIASLVKQRLKCVLFTFETNTSTAVARVLSSITGIPIGVCIDREGRTEDERAKMVDALALIDEFFKIYDITFNNPSRMEQVIRLERPVLAIVDHMGMVDPSYAAKNANRMDMAGDMADAALQWTIKYSLTVLLNSQLSNDQQKELKINHDLVHTSLFGSSRILNAMDIVLIGLRHWALPNTTYLRRKKDRKTGVIDVETLINHNPSTQSYEDRY